MHMFATATTMILTEFIWNFIDNPLDFLQVSAIFKHGLIESAKMFKKNTPDEGKTRPKTRQMSELLDLL